MNVENADFSSLNQRPSAFICVPILFPIESITTQTHHLSNATTQIKKTRPGLLEGSFICDPDQAVFFFNLSSASLQRF